MTFYFQVILRLVDEVIKGKRTGQMVSQWGKMDEKGWTASLTRKLVDLGAKNDDIMMNLKWGLDKSDNDGMIFSQRLVEP